MTKAEVKTRQDLAEYMNDVMIAKRPELSGEQRIRVIAAAMQVVKTDALVPLFLKGIE